MGDAGQMGRTLLQMGAIASVSFWGFAAGEGMFRFVYSIGGSLMVAVFWGTFIGSRSMVAIPPLARDALTVLVCAVAGYALASAGEPSLGVGLVLAALMHAIYTRYTEMRDRNLER